MNKKKLNEVLDIEDSVQSVQQIVKPPEGNDDDQIDKAYEYTRTNLSNII